MLRKVFLLVVLICLGTVFIAAAADVTFTGKIEEVAMKTVLTPLGGSEKILTIKLDTEPHLEFLVTAGDAIKIGLITSRPSTVLLPSQVKGIGWKVRLTCEKRTTFGGEPTYPVKKLKILD